MEPKTGKRIVSKGRYAANIAEKVSLGIAGLVFVVIAGMFVLIATVCLGMAYYEISFNKNVSAGLGWLLISGALGGLSFVLMKATKTITDKGGVIDPGVPLTRANITYLPAPDSLVRASSEPLQAQEGVLLRAAAAGQETASEQLVRASVGME